MKPWVDEAIRKGMAPGTFRGNKARRPAKQVPTWATSLKAIEDWLLVSARRQARVCYLYWLVGQTAKEVAAEVGMTTKTVQDMLRRLRLSVK